jgi:cyclase
MITKRIIPCLDVRGGRIVKGIQFGNIKDAGDPAERAQLYEEQGADEIVILDISATDEERRACFSTVSAVRAVLSIPLTVGGGVRTVDDARALLQEGADKVAVNTAAVRNPELLSLLAEQFGSQCAILALDARGSAAMPSGYEVVVSSGKELTSLDAVAWARRAGALGIGEIVLTSFDRDGTGAGYDIPLIQAISASVSVPVIASGGAGSIDDMVQAFQGGADAVLAASIFHYNRSTVTEVKGALAAAGILMRR